VPKQTNPPRADDAGAAPKRLRILGEHEKRALFDRPQFTEEDRADYFSLSQPEKESLREFRSLKSKAYFVLQLGYFKARHRFFVFDFSEVKEDLRYVLLLHFQHKAIVDSRAIDKNTRFKQQHLILKLCRYRSDGEEERRQLQEKACQSATVCGKPVFIFQELMRFLEEERIVTPGYTALQDMVGGALTFEQNRLADIVRRRLAHTDKASLRRLLDDSEGLYEITKLKRDPRDFTYGEIKREIARGDQIRALYHLAGRLLPELTISNESVRYYASLVMYYTVYRLKRFDEDTAFLYLLCFVYHRFQRFHDNLINSLLYHVRGFSDAAKQAARQRVYEQQTEINTQLQKAGQVLKLFTDDGIEDAAPFREAREKAFAILEREKLASVADQIAARTAFDETAFEWEQIDRLGQPFKYHLRPVLQAVDFTAVSAQEPLMEAMTFLKEAFRKGKPLSQHPPQAFPTGFIPESAGCGESWANQSPLPRRPVSLISRKFTGIFSFLAPNSSRKCDCS
jgi:hypothetical protein